ncbi:hypothetical protein VTH06DRAFT_6446 [Thermothelomyces fergusii]
MLFEGGPGFLGSRPQPHNRLKPELSPLLPGASAHPTGQANNGRRTTVNRQTAKIHFGPLPPRDEPDPTRPAHAVSAPSHDSEKRARPASTGHRTSSDSRPDLETAGPD